MVRVNLNWASKIILAYFLFAIGTVFVRNAIDYKRKRQKTEENRDERVNKKLIFPFSYFILWLFILYSGKWVKIKYNLSRFNAENFAFFVVPSVWMSTCTKVKWAVYIPAKKQKIIFKFSYTQRNGIWLCVLLSRGNFTFTFLYIRILFIYFLGQSYISIKVEHAKQKEQAKRISGLNLSPSCPKVNGILYVSELSSCVS